MFCRHVASNFDMKMSTNIGPGGDPMATPSIWRYNLSLSINRILNFHLKITSLRSIVSIPISICWLSTQSPVKWTVSNHGTLVNREVTSKEHIISLSSFRPFIALRNWNVSLRPCLETFWRTGSNNFTSRYLMVRGTAHCKYGAYWYVVFVGFCKFLKSRYICPYWF